MIVHGVAQEVRFGHPMHEGYGRYALGLYGLPVPDLTEDPNDGAVPEDYTGYIEPRKIFAQGYGETVRD